MRTSRQAPGSSEQDRRPEQATTDDSPARDRPSAAVPSTLRAQRPERPIRRWRGPPGSSNAPSGSCRRILCIRRRPHPWRRVCGRRRRNRCRHTPTARMRRRHGCIVDCPRRTRRCRRCTEHAHGGPGRVPYVQWSIVIPGDRAIAARTPSAGRPERSANRLLSGLEVCREDWSATREAAPDDHFVFRSWPRRHGPTTALLSPDHGPDQRASLAPVPARRGFR